MASLPIRREFWGVRASPSAPASSYAAPAGLRFGSLTGANFVAPHRQGITEFVSSNGGWGLRPDSMFPAMFDYGNWLDEIVVEATVSGYWENSTHSFDVAPQVLTWSFLRTGELRDLVELFPADPEDEPGNWSAQLNPLALLDWDQFVPVLCCNDHQRPSGNALRRSIDWLRPTCYFIANATVSPTGVPGRTYSVTRTELDPPEGEDPEIVDQDATLNFANVWWPRFYYSDSSAQLGGFDQFWVDQDTTTWTDSQWRDLRRTYSTFIDGEGDGVDIDLELTLS